MHRSEKIQTKILLSLLLNTNPLIHNRIHASDPVEKEMRKNHSYSESYGMPLAILFIHD